MKLQEFSTTLGGKEITVQFTDLAEQAHGSCLIKCENTVVLATAVMSESIKEGIDFVPLSVEYEEKFYASGQLLGSRYIRREGRPSEGAILSGRIIDRTIRPLFDSNLRNEVQVIITVLALGNTDPDYLAVLGASLALGTSKIPWNGPVSAVRLSNFDGKNKLIVNPLITEQKETAPNFEILACGIQDRISMIEFAGNQIAEDVVASALESAQKEINALNKFQVGIIKKVGIEKAETEKIAIPEELETLWGQKIAPSLEKTLLTTQEGDEALSTIRSLWTDAIDDLDETPHPTISSNFIEKKLEEFITDQALNHKRRVDGRRLDEIRPIFASVGGISPVLHGTGTFYRGKTHILSVLTLGGPKESQIIDEIELSAEKRYMHHYNFPPFSTGSTGRVGGINRRMVGHGALAEKALLPVLPSQTIFPYTIRVVSEALSSNGSTSMASVCGSTLALMDGGVPIAAPVAGISIGLVMQGDSYELLTDIQGPEDHYGDMDFKVAGTEKGITAIQLDIKVSGISVSILKEALERARSARESILGTMSKAIGSPRKTVSEHAPHIVTTTIPQDKIGLLIGPSGKTIKKIIADTGCLSIDIDDDGKVFITGKSGTTEKALETVKEMTRVFAVGDSLEGEVTKITTFGMFVRLDPKTEGLVHVSEIAPFQIDSISDYVSVGDRVPVIIKEIDVRKRLNLSIKAVHPEFFDQKHEQRSAKQRK